MLLSSLAALIKALLHKVGTVFKKRKEKALLSLFLTHTISFFFLFLHSANELSFRQKLDFIVMLVE